jgi:hypothetical protein
VSGVLLDAKGFRGHALAGVEDAEAAGVNQLHFVF